MALLGEIKSDMVSRATLVLITSLLAVSLLCATALAGDFLFNKELNAIGGYSKQDGWIDQSNMQSNSVGFEHYGKFSGNYGDYLTTDLQVRFAYDGTKKFNDTWGFQLHNAWAEYRISRAAKLRAGHFDPAFGLEPIIDTHSAILQTLMIRNIGYKKDWGISLNGFMADFDYQVACHLGSGMSIRRTDSSYLVTARAGTPSGREFQYGVSAMIGNVLVTEGMTTFPKNRLLSNEAILKKRLGFDTQYNWRSFLLKAETAYGINDNKHVIGYLVEADYTLPRNQNWEFDAQFQSWFNDLGKRRSDDSTVSMSLSYRLNQKITVRTAFIKDLNIFNGPGNTKALLQFYYYGK
jgi:hypothetical protein